LRRASRPRQTSRHSRKNVGIGRDSLDEMMPLLPVFRADLSDGPGGAPQAAGAIAGGDTLSFQRAGVRTQVVRRLRRGLIPIEDELDLHGFEPNDRTNPTRGIPHVQPQRRAALCENRPRQRLPLRRARPRAEDGGRPVAAAAPRRNGLQPPPEPIDGGTGPSTCCCAPEAARGVALPIRA